MYIYVYIYIYIYIYMDGIMILLAGTDMARTCDLNITIFIVSSRLKYKHRTSRS